MFIAVRHDLKGMAAGRPGYSLEGGIQLVAAVRHARFSDAILVHEPINLQQQQSLVYPTQMDVKATEEKDW